MKFIFFLCAFSFFSIAQTGPVANTGSKRSLICCGKATNQTTPPSTSNTKTTISNAVKQ